MRIFAASCLLLGVTVAHLQAQADIASPYRSRPSSLSTKLTEEQSSQVLARKLASIVLPEVEFRQTTLNDAVEYLRQMSRQGDRDPNPQARGVNIILQGHAAGPSAVNSVSSQPAIPRLTLSLHNAPLSAVLKYVADQAGLQVKVEPYAVALVPISTPIQELRTATFRVPPAFFGTVSQQPGTRLD